MFEQLGKILGGKLTRKDHLSQQIRIVQVFDLYRQGASQLLPEAGSARPVSLKDKVMVVRTEGPAHASELRLREHEILETINSHFGEEVVRRVVYRF